MGIQRRYREETVNRSNVWQVGHAKNPTKKDENFLQNNSNLLVFVWFIIGTT
jgi:hypothetical protein